MKKFAALLLAVLSLTGCSSKKSSDTEPPVENDDKAVETEIKVYDKSKFRRVPLDIRTEQKDVGIEIKELDLSGMDFGEKLSPCKTIDDPYIYKPVWNINNEEHSPFESQFEESLTAPAKGRPELAAINGDDIYIYANYDPYCTDGHSFAIFRYEISSGELSELYSVESIEDSVSMYNYVIAGGRIFYREREKEKVIETDPQTGEEYEAYAVICRRIMEIDSITGEESEFYSTENNIFHLSAGEDHIMVSENNDNSFISKTIILSTGEEHTSGADIDYILPTDPNGIWWVEETEGTDGLLDIVTDEFRLSTGLRNFSHAFVRGNKVSIRVVSDYMGYSEPKLFTYDFDKMEVYITDITMLGEPYEWDDNLIFFYNNSGVLKVSYFVPEIGTAFEVESFGEDVGYVGFAGGVPLLCESYTEEYEVSGITFNNYNRYLEKILWLE